jgi:hypothetical protein
MRSKDFLTAVIDNGSVGGNDGKDASATTAMMPVRWGRWHGPNNNKDTSNRGNMLCLHSKSVNWMRAAFVHLFDYDEHIDLLALVPLIN